jgi:asparagine synthase (glutamine-hydrolysing)
MSQGLETRFPLLAEPFRSYALGLPSAIKTQGRVLKWYAREAMRGHLPDEIVDKPKSGWGPPTGNWLAGKDP